MKQPTVGVAILAASLLAATGAQAHAHLVASSPTADSVVAAPRSLHLEFSEKLEAKFSNASLSKGGAPVEAGSVAKGKAIDLSPKAALGPGAYAVNWGVVSTDGHKSTGDYGFTVK